MEFSFFLKKLKEKHSLKSKVELYNHLGGKEKLSMTIRNFSLLESGDLSPSIAAFSSIFRQLNNDEYRDATLAFFESNIKKENNETFLNYISNNLSLPKFRIVKQKTLKLEDKLVFNSEQLNYLISNIDAMKILNRIVLFKRIDKKNLLDKESIIKHLKQLKLISEEKNLLIPTSFKYKLPSFSDSSSKNVRLASELILNHIDTYISEEGTLKQTFAYAFHLLKPFQIELINKEINKIKTLISNFTAENSDSNEEDTTPYLFVGFGKEVEEREFE